MPGSDVVLTFPRSALPDVLALSDELTDRMHELLERNTDGSLSPIERAQLETLVHMAQFGQMIATAMRSGQQQQRQP
jgi:hypothetical protein